MAIIRVKKNSNYTVMSNRHLRDKNLSLKAKGLMSQMLSLPDDWDYSVKGLCAINKENETAIKSALKELKENRYLVVRKITPDLTESGRFEYEYELYEDPQEDEKQAVEKQGVENLPIEIQAVENHGQLNKDKQSKEEQNTDEQNTECMYEQANSLESKIHQFWEREDLKGDPDKFIEYFQFDENPEYFRRNWKRLAVRWSDNEYVDMPYDMYNDKVYEKVMGSIPSDLAYDIATELRCSGCMQIKYRTLKKLLEILG